jgi:hypothetical protein
LKKAGIADLVLHGGYAPQWLVKRMINLSKNIFSIIVDEHGPSQALVRLSSPIFFQAFSNVLGFDWNSSGSTTVTCNTLKQGLKEVDLGIKGAGGKGKYSRMAKREIGEICYEFELPEEDTKRIRYASKMAAKVDNTAIQDGHQLYHHAIFISNEGDWTVVQQGMNPDNKMARRYHWLSKDVRDFVNEPHRGIVGERIQNVLNMTALESKEAREISVEIIGEGVNRFKRLYDSLRTNQKLITEWIEKKDDIIPDVERNYDSYSVKLGRMNWKAVEKAWKLEPQNYEDLLAVEGVGPITIRGLALVSELIYGNVPSWKDPVKYSFAYGGKDGVPFPVDRKAMDFSINLLEEAVNRAKLGDREKYSSLRRLADWRRKMEEI